MNEQIKQVLDLKGSYVETVSPEAHVSAAVDRMNALHIGALVVLDGDRVVGIFTERDVLARIVAQSVDPQTTRVAEVMTRSPVTVPPSMSVGDALHLMTERRCRHLPVFDGSQLRGLISIGDLISWIVRVQERTIHDLHDYIRAA